MPSNRAPSNRIARNLLWSVGGSLLPLPVAVLVVRPLLVGLGAERFGVLALAWALMGYFNLFDVGMGRATTHQVAEARATGRDDQIGRIFWTSAWSHLALGLTGGALLAASAPLLATHVITLSPPVAAETRTAIWLLALSVPLVVWSTAGRAILEASERFDLVANANVATATLVYLLPLAALAVDPSLPSVIGAVVLARTIGLLLLMTLAGRNCPAIRTISRPSRRIARELIGEGRWLTVSSAVTPALSTIDRLILASTVSAAVVGFYSIPYDIVTRLWLLTGALFGVLFPAFAALLATSGEALRALFARAASVLIAGMAPILAVIVAAAPATFAWWLGPAFAAHAGPVAQALAVGMLFSAVAHLGGNLLQAAKRSATVAAINVAQMLGYLVTAWLVARHYGPIGVAIVWMLRAAAQATAVIAACHASDRLAPVMPGAGFWLQRLGPALLLCAIAWAASRLAPGWLPLAIVAGSLGLFLLYAWHVIADAGIRARFMTARAAAEKAGL